MRKINIVLPAIASLLLISACGGTSGQATTDANAGSNRPAENVTEAEASTTTQAPTTEAPATTTEAPATTTAAPPENPVFGEAYAFENGLSLTVSAPTPYTPSESAATSPAEAYIVFDITVVNGSAENYDPTLFSSTLQSGNTEASQVYDSENNVGDGASTAVLPGREVTFKQAWGVSDPADLVMEVAPGFEYDSAIFTN